MEKIVEDNRGAIVRLCERHHVRRLDVFGSATTGEFDANSSDLDFLVTFLESAPHETFGGPYFELLEDLEDLFERRVDLVVESAIDNPYFRESVEETRVLLYGA